MSMRLEERPAETRRIQVFTRLYPSQVVALIEIGEELAKDGVDSVIIKRTGEVNTSEVIRLLLARADNRMTRED